MKTYFVAEITLLYDKSYVAYASDRRCCSVTFAMDSIMSSFGIERIYKLSVFLYCRVIVKYDLTHSQTEIS